MQKVNIKNPRTFNKVKVLVLGVASDATICYR